MPHEELRESVPVLTFPRQTLVSLLVFALAWEVLSHLAPALGIPPFAIPSLLRIAKAITTITPLDIAVTLARVIGALIVSFVFGIVLAMAMYRSDTLEKYLHPMIRILMAVPVVSWILFAVLWFPGVEFRIGFVLVVVCGPVFLVDTLDAMRSVPRELRQMMQSFRPTTLQYFVKLMLPAIVPTIFTSWKVNISLAIRVVTIAELVGAVTGIGHQLSVAQELFSVADVFAWTIVLVALLFLEMTDIVFAVDSVPAIFALTREPLIVFTSNILAILGLRSLYFMLAGAMDLFHLLKYGLGIVLVFVGLKMTVLNRLYGGHFPISISLGVIVGTIAVTVVLSLLFPKPPEEPR